MLLGVIGFLQSWLEEAVVFSSCLASLAPCPGRQIPILSACTYCTVTTDHIGVATKEMDSIAPSFLIRNHHYAGEDRVIGLSSFFLSLWGPQILMSR